MTIKRKPIIERFWRLVNKTDGCWEWTGSGWKGYGQFIIADQNGKQKRWLAHRFSWVIHNGVIPLGSGYHGTCVLHKCDNRKCVRPDHLFLGTNADNVHDMMAKGRMRIIRRYGEAHQQAKLTESQVRKILSDARSRKELSEVYGVHYNTIALIKRREKWRHIDMCAS